MKTVAKTLDVARSHLHERLRRPATARGGYAKQGDEVFLPLIRRLVDERPTYGYRRITALVNRELAAEAKPAANHKRVFRIMKRHGLLLARHTGRRNGTPPRRQGRGDALEPALVLGCLRDRLLER